MTFHPSPGAVAAPPSHAFVSDERRESNQCAKAERSHTDSRPELRRDLGLTPAAQAKLGRDLAAATGQSFDLDTLVEEGRKALAWKAALRDRSVAFG